MGSTHLTVESPTAGWRDAVPAAQISELRRQPGTLLWLDVTDAGPGELAMLGEEFGFHELALEDVLRRHQRPKCDAYERYYFLVVYAIRAAGRGVETHELQMFWGPNYLVTLHHRPLALIDEARKRWQAGVNRPGGDVATLVYSLLDSLVDAYMQVQDTIAERIEGLEERIYPRTDAAVVTDLFELRKTVLRLRRLLAPTRDVLNEIIRRDLPLYPEAMRPYFVDVYDHTLRVLESLDSYRDLLAAALDMYLSAVSNQLNQTVKRMTALTLIVMVPTLVAGIYGMNFTPLWPNVDAPGGFWFAIGLMVVCVAIGLLWARRADWL